ncbi:hypothetical protein BGW38_001178 [Lunasporangiospora selenospora]|uniref:Uncharacterized protein n=1 Tax=Lunasporangiospora selenospora TaxID=979761 RepID=A0A9P6G240_9FUNG|nr:hypothetical protein BGW38_001178 [Lunasporangiospora selenospora]
MTGTAPRSTSGLLSRGVSKKTMVMVGIVITITVLTMLYSSFQLQGEYHIWRNKLEYKISELKVLSGKPLTAISKTTAVAYEMYIYVGCTISPFASVLWHFNQAVKVCDAKNNDNQCSVKLKQNYDYNELAFKAKDWLLSEEFGALLNKSQIIVKLDDDTIIPKETLDGLVQEFSESDCLFAGNMRYYGDERVFWSDGPLFMVKSAYLHKMLQENAEVMDRFRKAEDVQMGALLNIKDPKLVCNVDIDAFRHRYYEDKRLVIRFNPYIKC